MSCKLVVTIDTEEEFDWAAPVSSNQTAVTHFAQLHILQRVFDECNVRPTYVIDYPVATQSDSVFVLQGFMENGNCEIGAHLHPWVNPPIDETLSPRNTFLCNLPLELQKRKLGILTDAIEGNFGVKPTTFKAGRYGFDVMLADELRRLGYTADTSMLAYTDMTFEDGPDFSVQDNQPFWIESSSSTPLLEVPCSVGFTRRPFRRWSRIHNALATSSIASRLRVIGMLWHSRIVRRSVLTPEGTAAADVISVMKTMVRDNPEVINITLHSSTVVPGNTQYVRNSGELEQFLDRLRSILEYAIIELAATPMTISEFAGWYATKTMNDG